MLFVLRFEEKLISMYKYSPAFVEGTAIVQTATFKGHTATGMHLPQ